MTVDEYIKEVLYSPEFDEYTRNVYRFEIRGYARECFTNGLKAEIPTKVLSVAFYENHDNSDFIEYGLGKYAEKERQDFPQPDLYS